MCSGSKSNLCPCDSQMESKLQENHIGGFFENSSNLLELAATDDLSAFILEVEEKGLNVNEPGFWYGRRFNSKKMGFNLRTPIAIASLYGSTNVLNYIIKTGKVDVNIPCGSDKVTPLHCAAASGSHSSVEIVKILIDAFAEINTVDFEGKRAVDLIPPSIKSSSLSKMLGGFEIEESKTPISAKKEYPIDISLPDINLGLYGSDEFRMYTFKVQPCSRAYSHDWTECPFVHPGENAKRRDLKKYSYTCVPCPEFKKGICVKGDYCEFAHGVFESWLHPAQYRTRLCKDETGCARKVCFFAHKKEELRPLYLSTGSAMPSPKSNSPNSFDSSIMSPLNLSPSVSCSSPMGGGGSMWQSNAKITPTPLQLHGSRLNSAYNAKITPTPLGLEKIRTRYENMQLEEMSGLNPTNLEDIFDPTLLSHLQSRTGHHQVRQNMNQIRSSYPSNFNYGFDSSSAVAAAVMNLRSSGLSKRSQSFNYRAGPTNSPGPAQSKLSGWGSPGGKLDWGYESNKLSKSASFGFRSNEAVASIGVNEPDVSWVNSLVRDVPSKGVGLYGTEQKPGWVDPYQMYIEQEQHMVA